MFTGYLLWSMIHERRKLVKHCTPPGYRYWNGIMEEQTWQTPLKLWSQWWPLRGSWDLHDEQELDRGSQEEYFRHQASLERCSELGKASSTEDLETSDKASKQKSKVESVLYTLYHLWWEDTKKFKQESEPICVCNRSLCLLCGQSLEGGVSMELISTCGKQKMATMDTQREVAVSQTWRGVSRFDDRVDEWRNIRNDTEMFWLV